MLDKPSKLDIHLDNYPLSSLRRNPVEHRNKKLKETVYPRAVFKAVIRHKKGSSKMRTVNFLFDSGALSSVVQKDAVKQLRLKNRTPLSGPRSQVISVLGTSAR